MRTLRRRVAMPSSACAALLCTWLAVASAEAPDRKAVRLERRAAATVEACSTVRRPLGRGTDEPELALCLDSVVKLRQRLSETGVDMAGAWQAIHQLVRLLGVSHDKNDPESTRATLVKEALACVASVASGTKDDSAAVAAEPGALRQIVKLLSHPTSAIAADAALVVGNVAFEDLDSRDRLHEAGAVEALLARLRKLPAIPEDAWDDMDLFSRTFFADLLLSARKDKVREHAIYGLRQLAAGKPYRPASSWPTDLGSELILLLRHQSDVITEEALRTISDLVKDEPTLRQQFVDEDENLEEILVRLFATDARVEIRILAMRAIDNMVVHEPADITQRVLDAGFLKTAASACAEVDDETAFLCAHTLYNIAAGTSKQKKALKKSTELRSLLKVWDRDPSRPKAQEEARLTLELLEDRPNGQCGTGLGTSETGEVTWVIENFNQFEDRRLYSPIFQSGPYNWCA